MLASALIISTASFGTGHRITLCWISRLIVKCRYFILHVQGRWVGRMDVHLSSYGPVTQFSLLKSTWKAKIIKPQDHSRLKRSAEFI